MLFSETKKAAIECSLFVSIEPISAEALADVVELPVDDVKTLIDELVEEYEKKEHGINIINIAGGYKFATKKDYSEEVEKILKPHASKLSRASLETLAIIAYKQPIIKAEVEKIRGVGVDRIINRLMEKDLIQEVGRKQTPGRPILYGTTDEFLAYFGLNSIGELPELKESGGQPEVPPIMETIDEENY